MKKWEGEKPEFIVCSHLSQIPVVDGSRKELCNDCGCSIWVSPSSNEVIKSFPGINFFCWNCASTRINNERTKTEGKGEEFELEFTYSPGAVKEFLEYTKKRKH